MKKRDRESKNGLISRIREKKGISLVYFLLRLSVILVMIAQFFNGEFQNVFLCILTLILFMIPSFVEHRLNIDVPDTLEIIILLFIYAAEILGEIRAFYITFPYWDTMLHTLNGFLCAAIGFSLVDILNREERFTLSLSPFFIAVTAFCFSMTIGVLWEFFEFGADRLFLLDMQKDRVINTISTVMLDPTGGNTPVIYKNITDVILVTDQGDISLGLGGFLDIGIIDTMKDLLVNFVGAVIFSVIGYFYVKSRGKGKFARRFIPRLKRSHSIEKTNE